MQPTLPWAPLIRQQRDPPHQKRLGDAAFQPNSSCYANTPPYEALCQKLFAALQRFPHAHTICFPSCSLVQLPSALLLTNPRCSDLSSGHSLCAQQGWAQEQEEEGASPKFSFQLFSSPCHNRTTQQGAGARLHLALYSEHLSRSLSPNYSPPKATDAGLIPKSPPQEGLQALSQSGHPPAWLNNSTMNVTTHLAR